VLLNNKFGVAIGIYNQLCLGWGVLENKEYYHEKYTQNGVSKKKEREKNKNEKGTNIKKSE